MCAWYAPRCLDAISRALDRGDRRVVAFFDEVQVARLPADEVERFGDPARMFLNVNTAEELADANSSDHGRGEASPLGSAPTSVE